MPNKDYYKTLGVERNVSADDLKKAFRALAHKFHPDKGGDEAKFKEVNEAYQVLGDAEKRAQYDRFGSQAFEAGGPFGGGQSGGNPFGGFSGFEGAQNINLDDLGDIFGNMFGFGGARGRSGPSAGEAIEMDLALSFTEAAHGVDQEIELYKTVRCDRCQGSGGEPGAEEKTCPTCNGRGQTAYTQRTIFGSIQTARVCPDCRGKGKTFSKRCAKCTGTGVVKERRKIRVGVPAGIANGETLRVPGEGEAGERGAPAGDLYLHVRVKPDPRFTRAGDDLAVKKEIGFSTAALGGEIMVETLESPLALAIPAGIQSGQVLRVRGRGFAHPGRSARGDLLIEITVTTPKKLSREQKKLLENLGLK